MVASEKLEGGLNLRSVQDSNDAEAFVRLSFEYNNASEGSTCSCLINHHPEMTFNDFQIIEDEASNKVVSTTCLIPWHINLAGVSLRAAMLEMVLTNPVYRNLGLVRKQMVRFQRLVDEGGYDFSFIWGIPYYYRQYGYSYAIEGSVTELLPKGLIPHSDLESEVYLDVAKIEDIYDLERNYNKLIQPLDIKVERSSRYWEYLIKDAQFPVRILRKKDSHKACGYLIALKDSQSDSLTVLENSIEQMDHCLAALQILKKETAGELYICWPKGSALVRAAQSLGSVQIPNTQWLFKLHDIAAFLKKINGVLDQRLRHSEYQNVTSKLIINLYKQAYQIDIVDGCVSEIRGIGFKDSSMGADGGDLQIPPDAFAQLVFGFRDLRSLRDIWPDIVVKPESRLIIETLFPCMEGYLYTPYHFLGQIDKTCP